MRKMSGEEERILRQFYNIELAKGEVGVTKALEHEPKILKSLEDKEYITWNDLRTYFKLTDRAKAILEG
tara:strand:- start:2 stop:208 length:207 start_codon:yes stop_codon:yes gene_type:complete